MLTTKEADHILMKHFSKTSRMIYWPKFFLKLTINLLAFLPFSLSYVISYNNSFFVSDQ